MSFILNIKCNYQNKCIHHETLCCYWLLNLSLIDINSPKECNEKFHYFSECQIMSRQLKKQSYPKRFDRIINKKISIGSSFPNELLYKIFDYLDVADLFKCSLVCRQWKDVSDHRAFWITWTKRLRCNKEFEKICSENLEISPKICFKRLYKLKKDHFLLKKFFRQNNSCL